MTANEMTKRWRQSEKGKAWQKKYTEENRERLLENTRRWRAKNNIQVRKQDKIRRKLYAEKIVARNRLNFSVKKGIIARPTICESCKSPKPVIQGHHHKGYDLPLEVIWLCPRCHAKSHPKKSK